MFKSVLALLAVTLLGACACLAPLGSASPGSYASFDDGVSAPVEGPARLIQSSYAGLERRLFSAPGRRQPDQREVLATSLDRAWRRTSHRRWRRLIKIRAV